MSPLLKIEHLRIGFGNTEAVRGIDVSLGTGGVRPCRLAALPQKQKGEPARLPFCY